MNYTNLDVVLAANIKLSDITYSLDSHVTLLWRYSFSNFLAAFISAICLVLVVWLLCKALN